MKHKLASSRPDVSQLNRRVFLKCAGMAVAGLSTLKSNAASAADTQPSTAADAKPKTVGLVRAPELGMKPHSLRVGDGAGSWTWQPAEFRFLHAPGSMLMPFGIVQMDNGEIALLGAICDEKQLGNNQTACAAFSSDGGSTWTDWHLVPDAPGRPMGLAYLGGGKLSFYMGKRFFSSDYGRTWPEQVKIPPPVEGESILGSGWSGEGSPLVERDAAGNISIAELGYQNIANYPAGPTIDYFRWSRDGGRTWEKAVSPKECSTLLSDGSILTAYGHYISKGIALIRWKLPAAR